MSESRGPRIAALESAADSADVSRRGFLTTGLAAFRAARRCCAALSPLRHLKSSDWPSVEEFLQKHYKEMTPEDKEQVFARIRQQVEERHHTQVHISDPPPLQDVEFVYGLNLSRCIGCRRCVHACVAENNQSRAPEIQYIRVLEMEKGSIDVETSDHHYAPESVPNPDKYYMPVQCHQCSEPPCVKVCPVEATWQEPDGITVIDYDWCIGCRYCEAACPYWARRFNFAEPTIPDWDAEPGGRLSLQSAAAKGSDGEVHLLSPSHAGGAYAGVSRGVSHRIAQVRQRQRSTERSGVHSAAQTGLCAERRCGDGPTILLLLR